MRTTIIRFAAILLFAVAGSQLMFSCKNKEKPVEVTVPAPAPAPTAPEPAPVIVAPQDSLMMGVADAVKDFPTVKTSVQDGVVTLTGEIKREQLRTLMQSLHTLHPKKIENQLTIK